MLALPTAVVLGRWLGTYDYGRGQWVLIFYGYAALVRTGAFDGASRALVHHRYRGELQAAGKVQNVGLSVELAFAIVPGVVLALVALTVDDPLRRLGLFLAPVAAVAGTLAACLGGLRVVREEFTTVARMTTLRGFLHPALLLIGASTIGPAALFLAPPVSDIITSIGYVVADKRLGIHVDFDRGTLTRLLRTGFPLGVLAIVYWAYRLVGSTAVAIALPPTVLGVYAFAAAPVSVLARAVASLNAVLTPLLWGRLAKDEVGHGWSADTRRLTWVMLVAGGAATSIGQAAFGPMVRAAAPKFDGSVELFYILSGNILLLSMAAVPSLVLDSERVSRQKQHLAIWLVGLALNTTANIVVLAAGWGATAVAWNDLWVQLMVAVVIFEAAAAVRALGPEWRRSETYIELAGAIAIVILVALLLRSIGTPDGGLVSIIESAALRVLLASLPWAAVGGGLWWAVRRGYGRRIDADATL